MNVFLLTEKHLHQFFSRETNAGISLYERGRVTRMAIDAANVSGVVIDDNGEEILTRFNFDLSEIGAAVRTTQQARAVAAALMTAWVRERESFFPREGTPEAQALTQSRAFARALGEAVGAKNMAQYLDDMRQRQKQRAKVEQAPPPETISITTGAHEWSAPQPPELPPQNLAATLDAEFTTPQLRELAKWLDVKLKGNAKSGYLESIQAGLAQRMVEMEADPDALLRGLSDEQADFARRILTARDWQLPVPRSALQSITGQRDSRDPQLDRRLTELVEGLRRHALLFPSHRPFFYGVRDSFYQFLPLQPASARPPVRVWEGVTRDDKPNFHPAPVFLEKFDDFARAVMAGGAVLRRARPPHARASQTSWLRGWEHDATEAEVILNSRAGWLPDQNSGVSVVLDSPLAEEGSAILQNQTGQTEPELAFYFALAAAIQLIEAPDVGQPGAPVSNLPARATHARARARVMEEWLALPDAARARWMWLAWQNELPFAPELARAQQDARLAPGFLLFRRIGSQDFTPTDLAGEFCALRRYATRVLRGLPVGAVVDWAALREKLFAFYPECAWQTHTAFTWWFAQPGARTRLSPYKFEDWKRAVGMVLEKIFGEAMALFGAVETARDKHGQLLAFRVTELGRWLVNDAPENAFPASAKTRVSQVENIAWVDAMRLRLPPAPDRAEFIRFARRVAEPTSTPFTYAITPASLESALKSGLPADEIARGFEAAGVPLPAQSRQLLDDMGARFGKIRVYENQTVLRLNDDFALRELLAATSLASHIRHQISPRAVIVDEAAVPELLRELEAKGYTPGVK